MGVNSLFIFLTHKTGLIRQFLPKHMAEGPQADLPEHGEAQSGQTRADEQRIPQAHEPHHNIHAGFMHRAQPYRTRKHRERARKGAYGPRGAQTNHASHTDPKTCSDQARIPCTRAMPPRCHHMNAYDDERNASDGIKQRAQWRGFKESCIPALSTRTPERRFQISSRSPCEQQCDVREDE